jgi:hypothetical protein
MAFAFGTPGIVPRKCLLERRRELPGIGPRPCGLATKIPADIVHPDVIPSAAVTMMLTI